jgi:hypothetical protein
MMDLNERKIGELKRKKEVTFRVVEQRRWGGGKKDNASLRMQNNKVRLHRWIADAREST